MLKIFLQKPGAFGLDISDLSLKIAKLDKNRLTSFGETKIPAGIIKEGEVRDKEKLSQVIEKAVKEVKGKKLKTKYVILSLPEEKSFLDVLQIPLMKKEELEAAVRFEAENHIPLSLDEVYFDFKQVQSIFNQKNYQEVLINACPKKIVDSYVEATKGAGLQPRALEIECLAITRALIKNEISNYPLLIIDFGGTRTTFIIFSGKSLRFTSTIPVSSQKLTESISKNLNLDLAGAERLKREQGLEGKKEVFDSMIPPLTDLIEQIKTHLDYYQSHEKKAQISHYGRGVEKILLCGGGANLKGLINFLETELKLEVELGNPWSNILEEPLKEVPEMSFKDSLSYATALGLALRGR